jgi:hypothetical protein
MIKCVVESHKTYLKFNISKLKHPLTRDIVFSDKTFVSSSGVNFIDILGEFFFAGILAPKKFKPKT